MIVRDSGALDDTHLIPSEKMTVCLRGVGTGDGRHRFNSCARCRLTNYPASVMRWRSINQKPHAAGMACAWSAARRILPRAALSWSWTNVSAECLRVARKATHRLDLGVITLKRTLATE